MPNSLAVVLRALDFAARKHVNQRRKDAAQSPYINHVIAVARTLLDVGGVDDPAMLAAALLHDTVEDTNATFEELRREFGSEIESLVREMTDDKSLPKQVRKELQIEHADGLSTAAKQLKLCDKICNVLDVTHHPATDWSTERRLEYLEWTERVIAGCRGVNAALEKRYDEVLKEGRALIVRSGTDSLENER